MENNNQDSSPKIGAFDHVIYINLEHRIDRKLHVEAQLESIGLVNYTRFNITYIFCVEHYCIQYQ